MIYPIIDAAAHLMFAFELDGSLKQRVVTKLNYLKATNNLKGENKRFIIVLYIKNSPCSSYLLN